MTEEKGFTKITEKGKGIGKTELEAAIASGSLTTSTPPLAMDDEVSKAMTLSLQDMVNKRKADLGSNLGATIEMFREQLSKAIKESEGVDSESPFDKLTENEQNSAIFAKLTESNFIKANLTASTEDEVADAIKTLRFSSTISSHHFCTVWMLHSFCRTAWRSRSTPGHFSITFL